MNLFKRRPFQLVVAHVNALCLQNCGVGTLPCTSNGGSPFWFYDYPRITDVIFTGPRLAPYPTCGLTSQKSRLGMVQAWRRVDCLSTQDSSKGYSATPRPHSFTPLSFLLSCLRHLCAFFTLRSWSVRYV